MKNEPNEPKMNQKTVLHLITNKEYQELNDTMDRTALRDLERLQELDLFKKIGEKKGTCYEINF